ERREWTEGLAEVDVTAPRPRPPGAQLAEGQRAGERDDAAGDPRGEREPGAADPRGHHLGPEKHAGPDDAADDRHRGGKDAGAAPAPSTWTASPRALACCPCRPSPANG